jgi:hypothetical protein
MRLTLATVVVTESSLTAFASSSKSDDDVLKEAAIHFSDVDPSSFMSGLHAIRVARNKNLATMDKETAHMESSLKKKASNNLRNPLKMSLQNRIISKMSTAECDPKKSASASDLGILSCGYGQYCMESVESLSGGFCTESTNDFHRRLDDFDYLDFFLDRCSSDGADPNITCSVCNVDPTAYTASIACSYSRECYQTPGLCDDGDMLDICGMFFFAGTITSPNVRTFQYCNSKDQPYRSSFCAYMSHAGDAATCKLTVEGTTCNSCEAVLENISNEWCYVFDCENTPLRASGTTCGDAESFHEAVENAMLYAKTLPCPNGCNLCGAGKVMGNPSANFLSDDGTSLNCFDAQLAALTGEYSGTTTCTNLMDNVLASCGCAAPPPVSAAIGDAPMTMATVVSLLGAFCVGTYG